MADVYWANRQAMRGERIQFGSHRQQSLLLCEPPAGVERLVLVDSYGIQSAAPAHRLSYLFLRIPGINELTWALIRRSRQLTRASLAGIFHKSQALSDELVEEVYQEMQKPHPGRAFRTWQLNELLWSGMRTDYTARLGEIRAPTLIVHGAHDSLVPLAYARHAQQQIAGSQLHILEGCGHWPQRENPAAFNQVVAQFLAS